MTPSLTTLRDEISTLDREILQLLARRMELSSQIAQYKKENGLPIYDPIREQELLKRYGKEVEFDITHIYQAIMDESKRLQRERIGTL